MDEELHVAFGRGTTFCCSLAVSGDTPTLQRCAVELLRGGGHEQGAVVACEGDDCRATRGWQRCSAAPWAVEGVCSLSCHTPEQAASRSAYRDRCSPALTYSLYATWQDQTCQPLRGGRRWPSRVPSPPRGNSATHFIPLPCVRRCAAF